MKIRNLFFAAALLMFGNAAMAQTATVNDEAAQNEQVVKSEQKESKFKAFADKHLNLSGYLQAGVQWTEGADPSTTFYLRRARVSLSGNFLKEKFDYRLQVDMAGSPKICDLYLRYKPFDALNVQLGQFKLPFSLENELYGPTKFEFIEYSYLTTYLVRNNAKYDGIGATGRDMGLQLYGGFIKRDDFNIINYNIGVFNGSGINTKDNNSSKDFIARLIIKPIEGLSISGSYMYAETKFDDYKYMKSPRWAVGAIYDVRHWIARAEFAQADFAGNTTNAFYALAGYHFERPWSVVARYEFINDELDILNEERVTLGGVYKPYKFLRLQLNLSYTMRAHADNAMGANLMVSAIF